MNKKEREMKSNKSQASVFIVFAIIIAVGGLAGYLISKQTGFLDEEKSQINEIQLKPHFDALRNSVNECGKIISENSLYYINLQGVIIKLQEISLIWTGILFHIIINMESF